MENNVTPDPEVTICPGILCGKYMRTPSGKTICAFQGIPYAKPPVGDLRFKAPKEPDHWEGVRDAKKEGPKCRQIDFVTFKNVGEEDCLYLNVYTPKVEVTGAGYDVMVWIHGGGFTSGAGDTDLYGPELLVNQNVVLVTLNYRLGVFGFLNLGTPEAPGNYGLKDQVAALKWVQHNISKFGGNPQSVTIFGESAGAGCIHYLLISPLARGLFHRAIAQSGSAHATWALQRNAEEKGRNFASRFCSETSVSSILKHLRKTDAESLFQMGLRLKAENRGYYNIFSPSVEPAGTIDAFLKEDPRVILARGDIANVPIIAGITSREGYFVYGKLMASGGKVEEDLRANYKAYVPEDLNIEKGSPPFEDVWNKILRFYEDYEPNDVIERYVHIHTDLVFFNGIDELVRAVAALRRSPVFYYHLSYEGDRPLLSKAMHIQHKGVNHADDLGYLFTRKLLPVEHESLADQRTVHCMTKLWTNFAKTGNPTPDSSLGVIWEPVRAPLNGPKMADTHYLDIGTQLVMKQEPLYETRALFWQQLYGSVGRKFEKSQI